MHKKHPIRSDYSCLKRLIKKSWDTNVITRALDLEMATDSSYINFIKPWVIEKVLLRTNENSEILDIGCGCGYLTNAVYECGRHRIRGIDISEASVDYAKKKYPDISFSCVDICDITITQKYDFCLAIMVLNNMPDIERFFITVRKLLVAGGKIIIVIPHPRFWPERHLNNSEYEYWKEIPYEFRFATKGHSDYPSRVLYFHRMIETYLHYIRICGFEITDLHEIAETESNRDSDILCMELELSV